MAGTKQTVTLDKAAGILGISKDGIRKRIQRGTIEAVRDSAGRWKVVIENKPRTTKKDTVQDKSATVTDILQQQIDFLKQELERKDHIIMALTQKVPLLEAPKQGGLWSRLFKRRQYGAQGQQG